MVPDILDFTPLLDLPNLRAGFSLKTFPVRGPLDRKPVANACGLPADRLVIPIQTHSNHVRVVDKPGTYPDTDGVVTAEKSLVLSLQVADCIPIYLVDPVTDILGMVHAGWRGIVNNIVEQTLVTLKKLGSKPENLRILLGPSIRQENFEIGPEIVDRFDPNFVQSGSNDRSLVDLQGWVIQRFIDEGVPQAQINDVRDCTYSDPEKYHSYRRDGSLAGRMIALLGWTR